MQMTLITPCGGADFERCRLLVDSVRKFVPESVEQVLIVDRRDVPQFGTLASSRTRVMAVESILPRWLARMPLARNWWVSGKSLPVHQSALRQLVKLGVGEHVESENYLFADADTTFVRPLNLESFADAEGNTALYRAPKVGRSEARTPWHLAAAKLLGFYPCEYFGADYAGNMITWRRDNLRLMYRHIEMLTGQNWMVAVCRRRHFSEATLYGVFVEHVLGGRRHYYDETERCAASWNSDLGTDAGFDAFLGGVEAEQIAVKVHSELEIPASQYAAKLGQFGQYSDARRSL